MAFLQYTNEVQTEADEMRNMMSSIVNIEESKHEEFKWFKYNNEESTETNNPYIYRSKTIYGAYVLYLENMLNKQIHQITDVESYHGDYMNYMHFLDKNPDVKYGDNIIDIIDDIINSTNPSFEFIELKPIIFNPDNLFQYSQLYQIVKDMAIEDEANISLSDSHWTIHYFYENHKVYITKTPISAFALLLNTEELLDFSDFDFPGRIDYSRPLTREYIEPIIYEFIESKDIKLTENEVIEYSIYVKSSYKQ